MAGRAQCAGGDQVRQYYAYRMVKPTGKYGGPHPGALLPFIPCSARQSCAFEHSEIEHCFAAVGTTHFTMRLQAAAHSGAFRQAEYPAAVVVGELHTAHTGGLAVGHTRYRRGDRRRDTTRRTADATVHSSFAEGKCRKSTL